MNRYGRQALKHWQTHLPNRFAAIEDPPTFFHTLGTQVEDEIMELSANRAAKEGSAETYLEQVGRLERIRSQAEEQILAERILLAPEFDDPAPHR